MSTIIIDSGGTSSDWAVVDSIGHAEIFTTEGMNPVSANIKSIALEVQSNHKLDNISKIYMYGAGCSTIELKSTVIKGLSSIVDPNQIVVESDLLGAAYALCGRSSGVISILGTGSNTAVFNGHTFTKSIQSGGYLLGDEGSGYMIGKELLKRYLRQEFEEYDMNILKKEMQLGSAELLNTIYSSDKPNHQIASYAAILNKLTPKIKESILVPIFRDFVVKRLLPFGEDLQLGLFFSGSIAFHYQKELTVALNSVNLHAQRIIPKPIEALINFHNEYL